MTLLEPPLSQGIDPKTATMSLADYGNANMELALRSLEKKTTDPYGCGRLRLGRRRQPHRHHRRGQRPRRRTHHHPAAAGLAAPQRRDRSQRATLVFLGAARHHRGRSRPPSHLLIRRNDKTGELAYYRCHSPGPVTLADYVRVAGRRWKVEESFQTSKGLAGLDEHQLRRWTSWRCWITLAMLAHAFLVVSASLDRRTSTTPKGLIPLTVNEFRRLFTTLVLSRAQATAHVLAWSRWRRAHQAAARVSHHRKQEHSDLRLEY
ncbi:hypothetical protein ACFYO7_31840 [Nocardia salmonicida]|uniref:hypothetical protein n=1 Tax=Nocardia salmonicida TaxID=53431 RepID=UPI00368393DF